MAVKKIHELTNEALTANDDDFFVIDVDNGDGSFTTKKIKKSNIPTGTNSSPVMKTGLLTSYTTGDDGNTRRGRYSNFFTLDFTNPFGNTRRFNGINGGYPDQDQRTIQRRNGNKH